MTKDLFFAERTIWHHDVSVWAEWDWTYWLVGLAFEGDRLGYAEIAISLLTLRVGVTVYRRTGHVG